MSLKSRIVISCLVVLTLLATINFGCGKKEGEKGKATITVGNLTDITGSAGAMLQPFREACSDLIKYYNENELIPGANLKVETYDTGMNVARIVPGYDWLRGKGAQWVFSGVPTEPLIDFAERAKVPVSCYIPSKPILEANGWVWCMGSPTEYYPLALLEWVSSQWTNPTKPKIGMVSWDFGQGTRDIADGIKAYVQAHPDQFDFVGAFIVPIGTYLWSGELAKTKDCDYVWIGGFDPEIASFTSAFRDKGYTAKFLGESSAACAMRLAEKTAGKEALDGSLFVLPYGWYNEPEDALGNLAIELIDKNRPDQKADLVRSTYLSGLFIFDWSFKILQAAVQEVGAENFTGADWQNAAGKFDMTAWEGYPRMGYYGTRYCVRQVRVYEYKAEPGDLVRVSDWISFE